MKINPRKKLGLFNDAVTNSGYVVSDVRMVMNNEFQRIWKKAVVT
jgi:hypothetical protein